MEDHVPGLDTIGFQIPRNDTEKLEYLLKSLWSVSDKYECTEGECGAYQEAYFRIWTHIGSDGFEQIMESNPMPGMIAHIEAFEDGDSAKAWFWDRAATNPDTDQPLFPALVRTPHGWFNDSEKLINQQLAASLSVIAYQPKFFDSEADLKADADLGEFAAASFIPTGLFTDKDANNAAVRPIGLVVGTVLLAVRSENKLSNDHFHALRVRTLGGECWVNLPDSAIPADQDVTRKIIVAQGQLTLTFPEQLPAPIADTASSYRNDLQTAEVEQKLRDLCIDFFSDNEKRKPFLEDIHFTKGVARVAKGAGVVIKGAKGVVENRQILTDELQERYRQAAHHAPIVFAHIVMANTMILHEGKSSPALVVIAFGEGADEAMMKAREVLSRIHFGEPRSEQEQQLAAQIEDEEYRFGKRRRLPVWLVGDVEAYAADLWIPGDAAFEDGLITEVLPCLAERGEDGLTSTIPTNLILRALGRPPLIPKTTPPTSPAPAEEKPQRSCLGSMVRLFLIVGAIYVLGVIGIILYSIATKEDSPAEDVQAVPPPRGFYSANRQLSPGEATGNNADAITHSEDFVTRLSEASEIQGIAAHTEQKSSSIAMIVLIPDIESKDDESRAELANLVMKLAAQTIEQIPDLKEETKLIVGIRGSTQFVTTHWTKGTGRLHKQSGPSSKQLLYPYFPNR